MGSYDNTVGVLVPRLLLPAKGVDMEKWAVVACDQYTSQPEYWQEVARIAGNAPSALNIMLPELYLDKPGEDERISAINATMKEYIEKAVLEDRGEGLVYVERRAGGKLRRGIVLALDLERYDYSKGSGTLIRASEGTVVSRIPPRLRIRKDAPLEMPHILVLIDDPKRTVIEPLSAKAQSLEKLYDFDLMLGGGHVEGRLISREGDIAAVIGALEALAAPEAFKAKYGDKPVMLFAMGDGNHSFATAKANWERVKAELPKEELQDHPARFCMVEIENVHDEGIVFEPIHRVVFGIDNTESFIDSLKNRLGDLNGGCEVRLFDSSKKRDAAMKAGKGRAHVLPFVYEGGCGFFTVNSPKAQLPVGTLQSALDSMLAEAGALLVDYIHGADVTEELGSKPGNMGFFLPPMDKSDFFRTVVFDGALPRKTFSMGEANEKRYYLECRRISK